MICEGHSCSLQDFHSVHFFSVNVNVKKARVGREFESEAPKNVVQKNLQNVA